MGPREDGCEHLRSQSARLGILTAAMGGAQEEAAKWTAAIVKGCIAAVVDGMAGIAAIATIAAIAWERLGILASRCC